MPGVSEDQGGSQCRSVGTRGGGQVKEIIGA